MEGKSFTKSPYFPLVSIVTAGALVVAAIYIGQIDLSSKEGERPEGREWRWEESEEESEDELVEAKETIEELQVKVWELEKELEKVRAEKKTVKAQADMPLRTKICEAEASLYAENKAREYHIKNFKKAIEGNDIASAENHLEASYEPKRTEDWEENYHKAYISCLEED